MKKKILKIAGISIGLLLLLLFLAPFLFKGSLEDLLKKNINKNLNAQVSWESLDISFFKSFPDAAVTLKNFSVVNYAPFQGDTLASGQSLELDMGIKQLLKNENDVIAVDQLIIDDALVNIKIDSLGNANYDISKPSETASTSEDPSTENNKGFSFNLSHYELNNARINYLDESSKTYLVLTHVNHEGTGDLSASVSELETQTSAQASFQLEDTKYLHEHQLTLDAVFQLDLENQKYTFLENKAKINELPLTFDGFIQPTESGTIMDISFTTPSSDFKNFLAVIPKKYVKNLDGVTTTGDFSLNGFLKGTANETRIPMMDISVKSSNASFKYPNLPKTVKNISLDVQLKNETGLVKDTYLNIGGVTFKIDDELFNMTGSLQNLTENMLVDLALKGTLDLANIEQVFPLELEQPLSGVLKADVTTLFSMNAIDNEQYDAIKTNGTASLKDFTYSDASFTHPINIAEANIEMSPGTILLQKLEATSGQTDISATGDIKNLIPWVMAKQDLKGRFTVQSNTFNVNDFMTVESGAETETQQSENSTTQSSEEAIKLPDFLDATLDFTAKKVIYDNINLENSKGTISIKDEAANLSNVTSDLFGGTVGLSGAVSTKNNVPTFQMDLDLKQIDIDESFGALSLLKYIAPIAKALDGNLNTTLNLSGELNNNLTPNLQTIAGTALAQIITAEVNPQSTPVLSKLGEQVSFLNLDDLSLQDISTALDFSDGKIRIQPFNFDVKGVQVAVTGSHALDKSMNYALAMDVPAKYLGGDVNKLLAKLDPNEAETMSVTIPVGLTGSFTNPAISIDTKSAVTTLTQRLIEKQKQDLIDKGTNILGDLLGGDNSTQTDSTNTNTQNTTQQTTNIVTDVLGGLFGKKKKKQDSTKQGNN